ncbi:MAG TPA: hypothetical protein VFE68_01895 [Vicinamibacteria bacterium]|nr:hypothetical protein [Vicinamibacteria bacterium]
MLIGVTLLNVMASLYESGWSVNPSVGAGFSDAPEVQAFDFPVPPSWP